MKSIAFIPIFCLSSPLAVFSVFQAAVTLITGGVI